MILVYSDQVCMDDRQNSKRFFSSSATSAARAQNYNFAFAQIIAYIFIIPHHIIAFAQYYDFYGMVRCERG